MNPCDSIFNHQYLLMKGIKPLNMFILMMWLIYIDV